MVIGSWITLQLFIFLEKNWKKWEKSRRGVQKSHIIERHAIPYVYEIYKDIISDNTKKQLINAWDKKEKTSNIKMTAKEDKMIRNYKGKGIDIHKANGKLPRPKAGFTPGKYKYMGPYNPLDEQLQYDKNTGEVTKWYVQLYNKVDEIVAYHDICYDMGKNKGDCD